MVIRSSFSKKKVKALYITDKSANLDSVDYQNYKRKCAYQKLIESVKKDAWVNFCKNIRTHSANLKNWLSRIFKAVS